MQAINAINKVLDWLIRTNITKKTHNNNKKVNKWKINKESDLRIQSFPYPTEYQTTHFITFTLRNVSKAVLQISKPVLQISIDGHSIDEPDHARFWRNCFSCINM